MSSSSNSASTESSGSSQSTSLTTSSASSYTSSSLSSVSSTSSHSSRSTSSSSSQTTASLSSSSISSESSPWDTEWFSILYCPRPTVKDYRFKAYVEVDLRHSDAEVLKALGPLTIDFGGDFGETLLTTDNREILDGLRVVKTFDVVEDAELWQDTLTQIFRQRLAEMRNVYVNQYPGGFELRHRRV